MQPPIDLSSETHPRDFLAGLRLVGQAFRLVWDAGPSQLIVLLMTQATDMALGAVLVVAVDRFINIFQSVEAHSQSSLNGIVVGALVLAGLLGVSAIASVSAYRQQQLLSMLVQRRTTEALLDVTTRVPVSRFDDATWYDRLHRAQMGQGRPFQLMQGIVQIIHGSAFLLGAVVGLWAVEPILLPLALLSFVPLVLLSLLGSRELYTVLTHRSRRDRQRDYLRAVLSTRDYAFEVRAYRLGTVLRERYTRLYGQLVGEFGQAVRRQTWRSTLATLFASVTFAGVMLLLGLLIARGTLSLAAAGAGIAGLFVLAQGVPSIGTGFAELYETSLFVRDYYAFLSEVPALKLYDATKAEGRGGRVGPLRHGVMVDHVTFGYQGHPAPVLHDVALELHRGEIVALVGENGAGKTTLAKLLCGFYQPSQGRILWDGQDICSVDPDELREQIAPIFQDFARYYLSARENIGFGSAEDLADLPSISRAARLAGVASLIESLPEGYETILGSVLDDGGTQLSGGQWQRIALARALFRKASFVILDEPTAAQDPRSERDLFERTKEIFRDRAVLLISHRLPSVLVADRIYVLDHGHVVESGTHASLLARGGLYAELFELQTRAHGGSQHVTPRTGDEC